MPEPTPATLRARRAAAAGWLLELAADDPGVLDGWDWPALARAPDWCAPGGDERRRLRRLAGAIRVRGALRRSIDGRLLGGVARVIGAATLQRLLEVDDGADADGEGGVAAEGDAPERDAAPPPFGAADEGADTSAAAIDAALLELGATALAATVDDALPRAAFAAELGEPDARAAVPTQAEAESILAAARALLDADVRAAAPPSAAGPSTDRTTRPSASQVARAARRRRARRDDAAPA